MEETIDGREYVVGESNWFQVFILVRFFGEFQVDIYCQNKSYLS